MAYASEQKMDCKPTIVGVEYFDPVQDAKELKHAMKGLHSDKKTIIRILTTRNSHQLQQIRSSFHEIDKKDLVQAIKDECSGDFEDVCVNLVLPRPDYAAKCLNRALRGIGTKEDVLIEILCTHTSKQIREMMNSYHRMFNKDLTSDVKGDTSGDFEKLLLGCLACKREKEGHCNQEECRRDAEALRKAGEKKIGTDEHKFIEILTTRSFCAIACIADQYEQISNHTLVSAIGKEMGDYLRDGLVTIVEYSRDPNYYFAKKLRETMKGMGTDDEKLIRIMITRSYINLRSIRNVFGDRCGDGKTLLDWIKSDTSGKYEDILVGLCLGNEQK